MMLMLMLMLVMLTMMLITMKATSVTMIGEVLMLTMRVMRSDEE